jgi:membrane-associated phospholipid phosphatase
VIALPLVHRGNRAAAIAAGYVAFCILYLSAGYLPVRDPVELAPGWLDRAVPFVPRSIWIYLSQFPLVFLALWGGADDEARSHAFYAMLLATGLAFGAFVLYPTTGPRPGEGLGGATGVAYRALYRIDVATNWFPSLHVALASLAAARWQVRGRGVLLAAAGWASLVSLSTLTTKQHYVVDVLGGLGVAWLAHRLVARWIACSTS